MENAPARTCCPGLLRRVGVRRLHLRQPLPFLLFLLASGVLPSSAWATSRENFGSAHFNSGEPDFGTPPRRAVRRSDDMGQDSRPPGDGGMSGGPVYTELYLGDVEVRAAQRAKQRAIRQAEWEALLAHGQWRQ